MKKYSKDELIEFEEDIAKNEVVMDLFCGTGTIGQLLSKRNEDVQIIGVDIVEEAIEDAKKNAANNQISNISFLICFNSSTVLFLNFSNFLY